MNKQNGEMEVELQGKKYLLKPTFEALLEVEDRAGKGLTAILQNFVLSRAGIRDVAAIIYGGILESGKCDLTFEQVGQAIAKEGFANFLKIASAFISAGMRGEDPDKEVPKGKKPEPDAKPEMSPKL